MNINTKNKKAPPSFFNHLLSIFALPFMVAAVIPFFIHFKWPPCCVLFDLVPIWLSSLVGVLFLTFGILMMMNTIGLFHREGNGTLAPWAPPQKLIVEGAYRYVRNPMISGVLFILLGEAMILQSENIGVWLVLFFILNAIYFVMLEEPRLASKFGADYHQYKVNVPRWIPRLTPWNPNQK